MVDEAVRLETEIRLVRWLAAANRANTANTANTSSVTCQVQPTNEFTVPGHSLILDQSSLYRDNQPSISQSICQSEFKLE